MKYRVTIKLVKTEKEALKCCGDCMFDKFGCDSKTIEATGIKTCGDGYVYQIDETK